MKTLIRKALTSVAVAIGLVTSASAATPELVWQGNYATEDKTLSKGVEKGKSFTLIVKMSHASKNVGSYIMNDISSFGSGSSFVPFCIATEPFSGFSQVTLPNNSFANFERKSGGWKWGLKTKGNAGTEAENVAARTDLANIDRIYVAFSATVGSDGAISGLKKLNYGHVQGGSTYQELSASDGSLNIGDTLDTISINSQVPDIDFNVWIDNSERTIAEIKQTIGDIENPTEDHNATALGACSWSTLVWNPAWQGGATHNAIIDVDGTAELTVDAAQTMNKLKVTSAASELLTLKNPDNLTVATYDFSAATDGVAFDATTASWTASDVLKNYLRTTNVKAIFKGAATYGATVDYGTEQNNYTFSGHYVFAGGTHTFQNCSEDQSLLFGANATADNPTLWAKDNTTLNFKSRNPCGWNASASTAGIVRIGNGATVNLQTSASGTWYWSQRFYFEPGATLVIGTGGDDNFRVVGGDTQATAQFYMPDSSSGAATISGSAAGKFLTIGDNNTPKAAFDIGAGSTLNVSAKLKSINASGSLKKYGSGTLSFTGSVSDYIGSIEVSAGTLTIPAGQLTGAVTIASGATLNITGAEGQDQYVITSGTFVNNGGTVQVNGVSAGYDIKGGKVIKHYDPRTVYAGTDASITFGDSTTVYTDAERTQATTLRNYDTLVINNEMTAVFNQSAVLAGITIDANNATVTINPGASSYNFDGQNVNIDSGTLKLNGTIKVRNTVFDIGTNGNLDNYGWLSFEGEVTLKSDADKSVLNNTGSNASHIQGSGTIVKAGSGTITLKSTPESNPVRIDAGALTLSDAYGSAAYSVGAVTGTGTLTIPAGATVASAANTITLKGAGTVVFDGSLPEGALKTSLQNANWTGTAWLKNKEITNFSFANYGHANSKVKVTGITGYAINQDLTFDGTLILADNGDTAALTINNGYGTFCYTIAKLEGSGTFKTSGTNAAHQYRFVDVSGFTGTITTGNNRRVYIGSGSTSGDSGCILIESGATATIASGKTWTAAGGFVINGTLDNNGTATGSVKGSGTLVYNGARPSSVPSGITANTWTGTVWLKNLTWTEFDFGIYGNAASKVKLTGVTGYAPKSAKTCAAELVLEDDGATKALTINNGWSGGEYAYTIAKLSGTGTWQGAANAAQNYVVTDGTAFSGSINLSNGSIIIFGTTYIKTAYQAGGFVYVESGKAAAVAAGKTWTANGGIMVDGSISGGGTLASATTFGEGAEIATTNGTLKATGNLTFNATSTKVRVAETPTAPFKVIEKAGATAGPITTTASLYVGDSAEPLAGDYVLEYRADGVYLYATSLCVPLGWSGQAWTNAAGVAVTTITKDHILKAKAGDEITFASAVAPQAFDMPTAGEVTVSGQNYLTGTVEIPENVTLTLLSDVAPGFSVTGTGTLAYDPGSTPESATVIAVDKLSSFTGTFWLKSGRHGYSSAIANAVKIKVTDDAQLYIGGGTWNNAFTLSGRGYKRTTGNNMIDYAAMRLDGTLGANATVTFVEEDNEKPVFASHNGGTVNGTLTGCGFRKYGSGAITLAAPKTQATGITSEIIVDYGTLKVGANSGFSAGNTVEVGTGIVVNSGATVNFHCWATAGISATADDKVQILSPVTMNDGSTFYVQDGGHAFMGTVTINGTVTGTLRYRKSWYFADLVIPAGSTFNATSDNNEGRDAYISIMGGNVAGTINFSSTASDANYKMYVGAAGTALANGTLNVTSASQTANLLLKGDATIGQVTGSLVSAFGDGTAARTLTLNGGTYGFVIQDTESGANAGAALSLVVAGTSTLTAANTYTGGTTVSGGTLALGDAASLGTGNMTVASGAVLNVGSVRPTGMLVGTSQGTYAMKLNETEYASYGEGAPVEMVLVNGDTFAGSVKVYDPSGSELAVGEWSVDPDTGKLKVTKPADARVAPYGVKNPTAGNWTEAAWKDSTTPDPLDVRNEDWNREVAANITNEANQTATLTVDRALSLSTLSITNGGTLAISAATPNTLAVGTLCLTNTGTLTISGDVTVANAINDSASTGTTTLGFATGAVSAGADTVLGGNVTTLTVGAGKKATLNAGATADTITQNATGTLRRNEEFASALAYATYLPVAGLYEFKKATIDGDGSADRTIVVPEGDEVMLKKSDTATVNAKTSLNVTGGTVYLGAEDNAAIWYGVSGTAFNMTAGEVVARATGTDVSGSGNGLLLSYSGAFSPLNISGGTLDVSRSSINFWNSTTINLTGSGVIKAKGVFKGAGNGGTVNVDSGATFEIGSIGWQKNSATFNLNGGTLKALEDGAYVREAINVTADSTIEVPEGMTLTAYVTGNGNITKTGEGTLKYDGGTTVRDFSGIMARTTVSGGTLAYAITETPKEYGYGTFSVSGMAAGAALTVSRVDGTTLDLTVSEQGTASHAQAATAHGAACYYDFTFTNTIKTAGGSRETYTLQTEKAMEYNTAGDALLLYCSPWNQMNEKMYNLSRFSVAMYGKVSATPNTFFISFGSGASDPKGMLFLATNEDGTKVNVVYYDGTLRTLSQITVPNMTTASHMYVFSKTGDRQLNIYLDGALWETVTADFDFVMGSASHSGVQFGSGFGSRPSPYDRVPDTDKTADVGTMRIFDYVISDAQMQALKAEFPYDAPNTYNREIATAAANWVEAGAWTIDGTTAEKPLASGSAKVTAKTETTVSVNLGTTDTVNYEKATFTGTHPITLVLAADNTIPVKMQQAEIDTTVTAKPTAADFSGAVMTFTANGKLVVDLSDLDCRNYRTTTVIDITGTCADGTLVANDKIAIIRPSEMYGRTFTLVYRSNNKYAVEIGIDSAISTMYWVAGTTTLDTTTRLTDQAGTANYVWWETVPVMVTASETVSEVATACAGVQFVVADEQTLTLGSDTGVSAASVTLGNGSTLAVVNTANVSAINGPSAAFATVSNGGTLGAAAVGGKVRLAGAGAYGALTLTEDAVLDVGTRREQAVAGAGLVDVTLTEQEYLPGKTITAFVRSGTTEVGVVCDKDGAAIADYEAEGAEISITVDDPSVWFDSVVATAQTNFNGSVVVAHYVTWDKGDYTALEATIAVGNGTYAGTVDATAHTVTFFVPGDVAIAGIVSPGAITVKGKGTAGGTATDEKTAYENTKYLYQGVQTNDANATAWFSTSASGPTVSATGGSWLDENPPATNSKIVFDENDEGELVEYTFDPTNDQQGQVAIVETTVSFDGALDVIADNLSGAQAAFRLVTTSQDPEEYRFAYLADGGWTTNETVAADLVSEYPVRMTVNYRTIPATVTYEVYKDGAWTTFGSGTMPQAKDKVASVSFKGCGKLALMTGSNVVDHVDARLVADADDETKKYDTIEAAYAAGKTNLKLLWDTSWDPSATRAGEWTIAANGHKLFCDEKDGLYVRLNGEVYTVIGDYYEVMNLLAAANDAVTTNRVMYLTNALDLAKGESYDAYTNLYLLRDVTLPEDVTVYRNTAFNGDTNILSGAALAFANNATFTIKGGCIGFTQSAGVVLEGGRFQNDTAWTAPTDYTFAQLATPVREVYQYQLMPTAAAPKEGEKLLPVTDAKGQSVSIVLSNDWAAKVTDETDPAEQSKALSVKQANGLTVLDNAVLGLTNSVGEVVAGNIPVIKQVAPKTSGKVAFKLGDNVKVDTASGAKVTYRVFTSTTKPGGKDSLAVTSSDPTASVELDLPTEGVKYYIIEVDTGAVK